MACPHLMTRSKDGTYYDYPSRANVCHAQRTTTGKGPFRRRKEWVRIPSSMQESLCLSESSYEECPLFRHAVEEK